MADTWINPPMFPSTQDDGDEPPPPPPDREINPVALGGWLFFSLGIVLMYLWLGAYWIYIPLFFLALMLSVAAMSRGSGHQVGLILLTTTLILPPALIGNRMIHPPQAADSVQTTQASTGDDRAIVEKINAAPLSEAHAWQVQVVHTRVLATRVMGKVYFTPDGENIIYVHDGGSGLEMVMSRLRDHAPVNALRLPGPPSSYDWSADGKRVAYITDRLLHIVDLDPRRDVALPPVIPFGNEDELAWAGTDKLVTGAGILDLETLEVTARQGGQSPAMLAIQFAAPFQRAPATALYKIENEAGSQPGRKDVYVSEQDGSYQHPLISQGKIVREGFFSPDQRHVLTYSDGTLIHHYLGLQKVPQLTFRIALNNHSMIGAAEQQQVDALRQQGISFFGRVYQPLTNPLNGRIIGASPNTFKGFVKLTDWRDSEVTVKISKDTTLDQSIREGDIVTEIASWQPGSQTLQDFSYGKLWLPLQASALETTVGLAGAASDGK